MGDELAAGGMLHWRRDAHLHAEFTPACRPADRRSSTPSLLASRTSRSRARLKSLASVGNITAFGCTVVSTPKRARSDGFIAAVRVATARLSCKSACKFLLSHPLAPPRQRGAIKNQAV